MFEAEELFDFVDNRNRFQLNLIRRTENELICDQLFDDCRGNVCRFSRCLVLNKQNKNKLRMKTTFTRRAKSNPVRCVLFPRFLSELMSK